MLRVTSTHQLTVDIMRDEGKTSERTASRPAAVEQTPSLSEK